MTAAVLAAADPGPGCRVVDLGCGTGQLSLPLAARGARVLAVDVSPGMITRLEANAHDRSLPNIEGIAAAIENLSLPADSVDLVVTSYALHHLRDRDKARVVAAAYRWLRPGATLVIADMMFGRGATSQDRAIIRSKVRALARKGIGGWWRIAKNGYRYLVRVQERPVSMAAWKQMLAGAGFAAITSSTVVAEAGIVTGCKPRQRLTVQGQAEPDDCAPCFAGKPPVLGKAFHQQQPVSALLAGAGAGLRQPQVRSVVDD